MKDTVAKIQALPALERALLAREALLRRADPDLAPGLGPREAKLQRMLRVFGFFGVVAVSLILVLLRVRAGRHTEILTPTGPALFIGIHAMREGELRAALKERFGTELKVLDQREMNQFSLAARLTLLAAVRQWASLLRPAYACLAARPKALSRIDVLSSLAMRLPDVTHLLVQLRALQDAKPDIVICCSTADLPAHAAAYLGLTVEYHQHGFLSPALVFPGFARMQALTRYEGDYVAARVPGMEVQITPSTGSHLERQPVLAFAGDYLDWDKAPVTSLAQRALRQGLQVVIRPHPKGGCAVWTDVADLQGVTFDTEGSFGDFLTKWRPSWLVTWFSTTLLDSLLDGALPVTLSGDRSDTVLPLSEIALRWPQDEAKIVSCLNETSQWAEAQTSLMKAVS